MRSGIGARANFSGAKRWMNSTAAQPQSQEHMPTGWHCFASTRRNEGAHSMESVDIDIQRTAINSQLRAAVDDPKAYRALEAKLAALKTEERRLGTKEQIAAEARAEAAHEALIASKRQTLARAAEHLNELSGYSTEVDAWIASGGKLYSKMLSSYAGLRSSFEDAVGNPLSGSDQSMMIEHAVRLRMKQAGLPIPKTEPDPRARPVAEAIRECAKASVGDFKHVARRDEVLSEALKGVDL